MRTGPLRYRGVPWPVVTPLLATLIVARLGPPGQEGADNPTPVAAPHAEPANPRLARNAVHCRSWQANDIATGPTGSRSCLP